MFRRPEAAVGGEFVGFDDENDGAGLGLNRVRFVVVEDSSRAGEELDSA